MSFMAVNILDKVGSVGAVIAGAGAPCCFPFLGVAGSAVGPGVLARYEEWMIHGMQATVLLALVGSFIAYRGHKKAAPLVLSIVSTAAIIFGINKDIDTNYIYPGIAGLLIVAVWNTIESRRCAKTCDPK